MLLTSSLGGEGDWPHTGCHHAQMSTRPSRLLIATYAVLAVIGLVGTQWALAAHFVDGRSVADVLHDIVATPAAVFMTVDLGVVAVAALVAMVAETRRLGLPRLWLYVVLTFTVAISVAFPLWLIERERHLAKQ